MTCNFVVRGALQRSQKTRAAQTPRQWKKVSKVLMILGFFAKHKTSMKRHAIALMGSTAAHHECGKAKRSTGKRSDLICVTLVFGRSGKAGRAPRPQHMIRSCPKTESHERGTSGVPLAHMHEAHTDRHQQEQRHLKGKHDITLSTEDWMEMDRKERLIFKIESGTRRWHNLRSLWEIHAQWSQKACSGKQQD